LRTSRLSMAVSTDIGLQNNDLIIEDGDFVIVESDVQHVSDTIAAFPGWWKENPADGVGILQYLKSSGREQVISRSIKIQLTSDGYKVASPEISITSDGLVINPHAEKL
jgi:hypothetical protein